MVEEDVEGGARPDAPGRVPRKEDVEGGARPDAPERVPEEDVEGGARPDAPERVPRKEDVAFETFAGLDVRAGRVTDVEDFPEARAPVCKLTVDFGPVVGELRTAAQLTHYPPAELTGRMVVGALNLGRKRVAGFTSEFLVLGTMDPDGTARLLRPEDGVQPGAPVA